MRESGIERDLDAAAQQETPTLRAERGIVYAFHPVPYRRPAATEGWGLSKKSVR